MPDKQPPDPQERDEVRGDDVPGAPGDRPDSRSGATAGGPILPDPAAGIPAGSPLPIQPEDFPPDRRPGPAEDERQVVRGPQPLDPESNERDYRPPHQLHTSKRYHYGRQPD